MPRSDSLEQRYPWAKIARSPDTIVPHRVPFPLARRFHQICATVLAEILAHEDLPAPMRYTALACIDDFAGIDQRRLAVLVGIDRTNAGQIVDELEAKGLVERRINGADRRARELYATSRGRDLRRRMRARMLAAQDRIMEPLAPKERELLIDLLTRVVEANHVHARPGAGRRPPRKRSNATDKGGRNDQDARNVQARARGGASAR
jgi:DNA-binding MarR family transcriptional regulator